MAQVRLTLLGIGAMNSPRYWPAGLLIEHLKFRIMLDGGLGAAPGGRLNAWLVTDERGELIREIRTLAENFGIEPHVGCYACGLLKVSPLPVVHTAHPTYGYLLTAGKKKIVWAPEFPEFPAWANAADLMFAEAAGWCRLIRFAHGAGGHACALDIAQEARRRRIRRLVFAHIGRPTIRAIDDGHPLPFGEFGVEGRVYRILVTD